MISHQQLQCELRHMSTCTCTTYRPSCRYAHMMLGHRPMLKPVLRTKRNRASYIKPSRRELSQPDERYVLKCVYRLALFGVLGIP
ncbi:hypothetical protein BJX63DRAFT_396609 [Aspergillus granulosus]|uniref:Uncharacterized protein n=1 Tax=Aspergillus granulosus TaxID=176169 RepID=A0ABR4HAN8_9EURO